MRWFKEAVKKNCKTCLLAEPHLSQIFRSLDAGGRGEEGKLCLDQGDLRWRMENEDGGL